MAVVSVQKNLLDHVRQCKGVNTSVEQLKITQCLQQKAAISGPDLADVKRKEVARVLHRRISVVYCRYVEHVGLRDLLQTFADLGAKYGKFDVNDVLYGRSVVTRETMRMSTEVKVVRWRTTCSFLTRSVHRRLQRSVRGASGLPVYVRTAVG